MGLVDEAQSLVVAPRRQPLTEAIDQLGDDQPVEFVQLWLGGRTPVRSRGGGPSNRGDQPLAARQVEVLGLVAEGLSNVAIAEQLVLSPRTVEHHVSNILQALRGRSRTEAAASMLGRHAGPRP